MSWISQPWFNNMAIDYYNSSTGVTSRIATGALRVFWQDLAHQNTIANDLNGSGNLQLLYGSYTYSSDPQYDEWGYAAGEMGQCSDLVRGSYLCQTYFENGHSGDIIWWYNNDNPNFKIGLEYRGKGSSSHGIYYKGRGLSRTGVSTLYGSDNRAIAGIDANGSKREWVLSVMIDGINKWAYPIYMMSVANPDPDIKTGNSAQTWGWYASDRATFNNWRIYYYQVFKNLPPEPTDDPYPSNNYGPGESQGGEGEHDDSSDTIAVPSNPSLEVTSSGMVTIFTPSLTQIQSLATALIDPNFFQALGNVFASLDQVILGLHIVPLVVPYSGPASGISINLLGIAYRVSIGLYKATVQFIDVDCGTIDVDEYWGNCLDYNPYTKITIFLPFIGYVDIDADDVMNKTVGIKYRVDIATGACIAFISADGSVMYQYAGNCALPIPVSSTDQNSAIQNIVSIATAAVTGGAGIAAAGAAVAEAEGKLNEASGYKEIKSAISGLDHAKAHYQSVTEKNKGKLAGVSANAVVNSKAQFHHGGSLGASAGFMGIKKPYMIIRRPKQMIPDKYGAFNGYPANTYVQLGDLLGYTRVSDIRLNIPDATVDEIMECERLLKEGVVL